MITIIIVFLVWFGCCILFVHACYSWSLFFPAIRTKKTKRKGSSKYTGPRGDWSDGYGYITRAGDCVYSALLATHEGGQCPGPSSDPRAADAAAVREPARKEAAVNDGEDGKDSLYQ
jgi:hypothetical protein